MNAPHNYEMRFQTGQTISPSYLFNVRILQVALALVYLILVCYCGVHHGWWLKLHQPLGFGSACSPSPHRSCIHLGTSSIVLDEECSPFFCYLYDSQSLKHLIARLFSHAQQSSRDSKRARPPHRHQNAVPLRQLTFTQSQHRSSRF